MKVFFTANICEKALIFKVIYINCNIYPRQNIFFGYGHCTSVMVQKKGKGWVRIRV